MRTSKSIPSDSGPELRSDCSKIEKLPEIKQIDNKIQSGDFLNRRNLKTIRNLSGARPYRRCKDRLWIKESQSFRIVDDMEHMRDCKRPRNMCSNLLRSE